jgi:hypothetical protein
MMLSLGADRCMSRSRLLIWARRGSSGSEQVPEQGGSGDLDGIVEQLGAGRGWERVEVDEFATSVCADAGQAEVGLDESPAGIPADRVDSGFNLDGIDEMPL